MVPYIEYDFDPRNLPQDILAAIGLVTTAAAQTETIVEMAIAGCCKMDSEYGGAITTHMSMPLRFSALRSAAELHFTDTDDLDELDILIDHCDEAFGARNDIVHHEWCRNPSTNEVFTVQEEARSGYQMNLVPMSIDRIKSDASYIYWVGMDLMDFLIRNNIVPELPPAGRYDPCKTRAARKKTRKARLRARGGQS